ncbi:MAG: M23 family metallopeptidase [bacterium]|nr:M23 family metallopeptidase [bacterium]
MERFNRRHQKAILERIREKTGADVLPGGRPTGYMLRRAALPACSLLCIAVLCAFTCLKFSGSDADKAGFAAVYQGDGRFEIVIINDSDRELKLQDSIKVMQWSTGEEVEGDREKIRMSGPTIAPHSEGTVFVDLSEGYDVEAMMENLQEGDIYYFVLTNNYFAFGQDWMCFFDFEIEQTEEVRDRMAASMQQNAEERKAEEQRMQERQDDTAELFDPDWRWPTVSRNVTGYYGMQLNGKDSDHINIAGTRGDEIYAVADGTVTETGFEAACGNYIVLDLGDGVTARYGFLEEIRVSGGDGITQGQVIATLGKSGTAVSPNLLFAVSVRGETVNPLAD